MRSRDRVLQSLENVYREAFLAAEEADDKALMAELEREYQRDQLHLEVLMDIRDLLAPREAEEPTEPKESLLDKAQKIRRLTKLRP